MITLRPYQDSLIEAARVSFRRGKRSPLLVSPVGSGKTVCFAYFASRVAERGKRTFILAHRDELLDQISQTLVAFNVRHSFIAQGRFYNPCLRTQVCSVFSLARRVTHMQAPDIIVIDEAHHAIKGSSWSNVFEAFKKSLKIGVTATPERLSGEGLDDTFDDLILGPSVRELIDLGSLCDYRIFAPSTIDTSKIHTRMGDFNKTELAAASDKPTITGDAIKEYERLANGKRAIVFCVSIEHAKHVAGQFAAAGHKALSIDGKLNREVRRDIVRDFREGKINVLTSCDIISEGFDLPAIEVAIMLRPTQSLALWIQQTGRALRPHPGKEYAIILDHAGNCQKHGLPDEPREWSLKGRSSNDDGKGGTGSSVRVCARCFAAQRPGRPSCAFCGFLFKVTPREVEHVAGELVEVDAKMVSRQRAKEQGMADSLEALIALGRQRKYKNPTAWAYFIMRSRGFKKMEAKV